MDEDRRQQLIDFLDSIQVEVSNLDFIDQSLTHSSFAYENQLGYDNERLEFLGDSILGFVIAAHLLKIYPQDAEGNLSRKRSKLVSRIALGKLARSLGLGEVLHLGRGEQQSGGVHQTSIIGSALEALIGAIYLSEGLEKAEHFIHQHIVSQTEHILTSIDLKDYKSRLQEIVQSRWKSIPAYRVLSEEGPDHQKLFEMEVIINGKRMGTGKGNRKKQAENDAARQAIDYLLQESDDE